jgi:hypothetical protein
MMSLVFTRGLSLWAAPARALGLRFSEWLAQV